MTNSICVSVSMEDLHDLFKFVLILMLSINISEFVERVITRYDIGMKAKLIT